MKTTSIMTLFFIDTTLLFTYHIVLLEIVNHALDLLSNTTRKSIGKPDIKYVIVVELIEPKPNMKKWKYVCIHKKKIIFASHGWLFTSSKRW